MEVRSLQTPFDTKSGISISEVETSSSTISTANSFSTVEGDDVVQFEGYITRSYRPGDEHAINEGFNQIFRLQRPIEEWQWKFQPDNGDWILMAFDEQERLIAHFAVNRQYVKVDDRVFCAGQAVDVYRIKRPGTDGKLVFSATVKDFYRRYGKPEEINFLFGFPGKRHMSMGRVRLQYVDPIRVPVWRRKTGGWQLFFSSIRVKEHKDPEELDALWRKCAPRYKVSVVRDGARLIRRYLSRPGNHYICVGAWKGETMHAWAVFKVVGDTLMWVDLLWDGHDDSALISLDNEATRIARRYKLPKLEMWLAEDKRAAQVLQKRGWIVGEHEQQLEMTSVLFNPGIDGDELVRNFYFTMGDSDLI